MRRSSLASDEGDFGHWGKAVTFFSTSVLSWASSSVGVPDQSFVLLRIVDGLVAR